MPTTRVSYLSLVKLAKENGFTVTCPWDASYQKDMTIWNRRLQTGPAMIAFCSKTEHVQVCVKWCRDNDDFPLRVRSGRHHHEGMSCAYGVLIIDLSPMHEISYPDHDRGWIPPGKQLQCVYEELDARKQIIPGGGCETVCVGGLTLGGGWGMSARALGLTCDNILEAEIVKADGSVCRVKASDTDPKKSELFWALRGGGAGNFGIVTNFLFKLTNVAHKPTTTTEKWTGDAAFIKMQDYTQSIANDSLPRSKTLACRLFLEEDGQVSFSATCQVLEVRAQADEILGKLVSSHPSDSSTVAEQGAAAEGNPAMHHFADSKMMDLTPARPADTCLTGPLPHKVSSAFVKVGQEARATEACFEFLRQNNKPFPRANTYISFHSFGGKIGDLAPNQTAFPYRDRKLLLQFQAWWSDPADESTDQYIDWIQRVRINVLGYTDGGFFNFQDASIVPETDRHALMKYYYGSNLNRLIDVKIQNDPTNVFQSGMSIPNKR